MTVVVWIAAAILAVSALLVVVRVGIGPTMLNRVVALDLFAAILVCGLCVEAAYNSHSSTLPVLVALSLVGFVGSVSVARFASREKLEDHP